MTETLTAAERYRELRDLIRLGESPHMAVIRLHVNLTNAIRWFRRNGDPHTARILETLRNTERKTRWTPPTL